MIATLSDRLAAKFRENKNAPRTQEAQDTGIEPTLGHTSPQAVAPQIR